ncbi:hypothetical protein D3C84_588010 [compost metagenome]
MGEQGVHLFAAAMDHLQHALGRAGLDEEFGEAVGGQRVLLGRLEDEGVAAGDGQRKHPQRDHRRKVEGGDADAHAQWLDPAGGVDLARDVFHGLAHHQAGHVGGVLDHLDAAPDITLGIGQGLAGFAGQQLAQLVVVLLEQLLVAQHQPGAFRHRHFAPALEGVLGAGDGGLDLLGGGLGRQGQDFLGRRVGDLDQLTGAAFAPLAVDQQRDCLGHLVLHP